MRSSINVWTRCVHTCSIHHSAVGVRWLANTAPVPSMSVFDAATKRAQRERAVIAPNVADFDYLRREVATRLTERIADISRSYGQVVDISASGGHIGTSLIAPYQPEDPAAVAAALTAIQNGEAPERAAAAANATAVPQPITTIAAKAKIQSLLHIDHSPVTLSRTHEAHRGIKFPFPVDYKVSPVVNNEPIYSLPEASVDLVMSNLWLHWVNDLPGYLTSIRKSLRPDGTFIGAILGGSTLQELRSAFAVADMERRGGVTPHISPFAGGRDVGDLLGRAGFTLPTIDHDIITIRYPDMFTLMDHLQSMGEGNAASARAPHVPRDVFLAAAAAYKEMYQDDDGLIPATFQVIYMIGWSPAASQPLPKKRGSATARIGDLPKPPASPPKA